MSEQKLAGRVALITGGNKGLGKAMAAALGRAGARVALASRDLPRLNTTASELKELGVQADVFQADVTSESDVARLAGEVGARYGRIQILINNAGINIRKPVTEFSLEEWRRVLDTNLTGVFLMCRAFV